MIEAGNVRIVASVLLQAFFENVTAIDSSGKESVIQILFDLGTTRLNNAQTSLLVILVLSTGIEIAVVQVPIAVTVVTSCVALSGMGAWVAKEKSAKPDLFIRGSKRRSVPFQCTIGYPRYHNSGIALASKEKILILQFRELAEE